MFRLKSKSSTADRGVPAQVGFNNTDILPANDIIPDIVIESANDITIMIL